MDKGIRRRYLHHDRKWTWNHSEAVNDGDEIEGLALIETDNAPPDKWIRVYLGYTYTLQTTGNVHYYTGNNAGLDAE